MRFAYVLSLAMLGVWLLKFSLRVFVEAARAVVTVAILLVCGVLMALGWAHKWLTAVIVFFWGAR